jgi:leucyl aminopeptidase
MKFSTNLIDTSKKPSTAKNRFDCLVVPVHQSFGQTQLSPIGQLLDSSYSGQLSRAIKAGDVGKKVGHSLLLRLEKAGTEGLNADRVILINMGPVEKTSAMAVSEQSFLAASKAAIKAAMDLGCKALSSALNEVDVVTKDDAWKTQTQVVAIEEAHYKFIQLKSATAPKAPASSIVSMDFVSTNAANQTLVAKGIKTGEAISAGINVAKTLGNLPGNFCTPTHLAKEAQRIGKALKFKVEILERKQIQALKMGSFLSVAQGSSEPPKLIVMQYQGASAKEAPIALVGKGITFDTGGISLKPGAEMDEMKFDMCGAASVIGTFQAIAQMKLKVNVVGALAMCSQACRAKRLKFLILMQKAV